MLYKIKAILRDTEHRHTAINAAIALTLRVLGAGMAFLFNLIIARQLGAEQSGYFFPCSCISNVAFSNCKPWL